VASSRIHSEQFIGRAVVHVTIGMNIGLQVNLYCARMLVCGVISMLDEAEGYAL